MNKIDIIILVIGLICLSIGIYMSYKKYMNNKFLRNIKRYEKMHKTNLLFMIDKEWDTNIGTMSNYILDIDDSDMFIEKIHKIKLFHKYDQISIILNTVGGYISSSDLIVEILKNYKSKVTIYIPCYAFSAGTMLALCGDEIYMNDYSMMGPVDPQLTYNIDDKGYDDTSSQCLLKLIKEKEDVDDQLYLKALESKFLHDDNMNNLRSILDEKNINLTKKKRKKLLTELGSGKYPHHKPFSVKKIKNLGIDIKVPVPNDINILFNEFIDYKNNINQKP
jgi:ClpP class serine protease